MMSARTLLAPAAAVTPRQEEAFFSGIQLRNGTFKTTTEHRLDDLNQLVIEQWKTRGAKPRLLLDVGASSGVSSVEWLESLSAAGFDIDLVATDVCLKANLVPVSRHHDVLVDRSGHILQHIVFGIAIRPWPRKLDFVTGYALLSGVLNCVARRVLRRRLAQSGSEAEEIMLVSRRAREHAGITFAEDDVFAANRQSFVRRFDAIRAANLLNCGYFSTAQIRTAIFNLKDRLVGPDCFLIVNRTRQDGTNHGTLFQLNAAARFEILAKLREGSEIEDIVLAA
jgi:hypothetical protein